MSYGEVAEMVGTSEPMRGVRELIARVAPTKLPVLVQGPTGVGKELVARAVHRESGRGGPLVAVNICAITETMFEDALYGHVRGAFTGAVASTPGYMPEAHGGSLFLDEIGSLPVPVQTKLLRSVETGEFRPIGGQRDRRSDFRVIAATNVSLPDLVAQGRFRADLAHRLSGFVIDVPPLSARTEDVAPLARHFARRLGLSGNGCPPVTDGAVRILTARPWRGNVRELRLVIERAAVMGDGHSIDGQSVDRALALGAQDAESDRADEQRRRLVEVCRTNDWDATQIAGALGVGRATLYRRLRQSGISLRSGGEP